MTPPLFLNSYEPGALSVPPNLRMANFFLLYGSRTLGAFEPFERAIQFALSAERIGSEAEIGRAYETNYRALAEVIASGVSPYAAVAWYRRVLGAVAGASNARVATGVAKAAEKAASDLVGQIDFLRVMSSDDEDFRQRIVEVLRGRSLISTFLMGWSFLPSLLESSVTHRPAARVQRAARGRRRTARVAPSCSAGSGADGPPPTEGPRDKHAGVAPDGTASKGGGAM